MAAEITKKNDSVGTKMKQVMDGWKNVLTGLGVSGRDKRLGGSITWTRMTYADAENLYSADDMAQKIVDVLPEDMFREGFYLKTDDPDHKQINTDIQNWLDEKQVLARLQEGMVWGRMYGGAGTVLGVNDGAESFDPINEKSITSIDFFTNLNKDELFPFQIQRDPSQPDFGIPEIYRMQPMIAGDHLGDVHNSRVLRWNGALLPRRIFIQNNYWHDSVLNRPQHVIRDFQSSYSSVANLLQDFAQAVYKIKNLTEMIAQGKDGLIQKRLELVDRTRSIINAIVLEEGEEFDRKVTALTGIPDVLDRMARRMVMAADMPHTKLLGESPSGLGATGESEETDWNTFVARQQVVHLLPNLTKLIRLVLLSKEGPTNGKEPKNWRIEFKPLKQQSQKEINESKKLQADIDKIYWEIGSLGADEIAESRFGGDEFSYETTIDKAGREAVSRQNVKIATDASRHIHQIEPGVHTGPDFPDGEGGHFHMTREGFTTTSADEGPNHTHELEYKPGVETMTPIPESEMKDQK